jgi:hypothetical protein
MICNNSSQNTKGCIMKNYLKKYLFESNNIFLNVSFIGMYIAAFVISLKWNNTFHTYWGFVYLLIALAVIREGYKMLIRNNK